MAEYGDSEKRFKSDTAKNEMTVLHDDGLYRHLRFKGPDSGLYWFDLVTWPGSLAIRGDTHGLMFTRLTDMFEFFRGDRINPGYWAEKTEGGRDSVKSYSEDLFRQLVAEDIEGYADKHPGLADAVEAEIFDDEDIYYEHGARAALEAFEHDGFRFHVTWDWDFRDYTAQFLWACHAIQWGIRLYDAKPPADDDSGDPEKARLERLLDQAMCRVADLEGREWPS